ncbi:hypothetical protein CC79DRAFT_1330405 [Sarocladium strictum]
MCYNFVKQPVCPACRRNMGSANTEQRPCPAAKGYFGACPDMKKGKPAIVQEVKVSTSHPCDPCQREIERQRRR